jgi:RimJ/RimL family protein N-acetyltransferase
LPFEPPTLRGKTVYLRAVLPGEYEDLYLRESSGELAPTGGLEGRVPSFEEWVRQRSLGVLAQFVAVRVADNGRAGLVTAFSPDFRNGHAHVSIYGFDPGAPEPHALIGLGLLIEYAFGCWPLHKLYLDVAEYSYPQFATGTERVFVREGRLKDHHYLGGRRWDHFVLAIYRDAWAEFSATYLRGELRG